MQRVKIFLILGVVALLVYVGMVLIKETSKTSRNDFRMVVIDSEGIVLKSISTQRRMQNELKIDGDVKLWIPGGMGWYESNKIEKLLIQEKALDKVPSILFFNFGFVPDMVIYGREDGLVNWWKMVSNWGWKSYLVHLFGTQSGLMIKQETINKQLPATIDTLGQTLQRDFADSQIIEEGIRISVYNLGGANGLGGFMARNLESMGLTVLTVENLVRDLSFDNCLLVYGKDVVNTYTKKLLMKQFDNCQWEDSNSVGPGQIDLFLGDKYAKVINYEGYNNNEIKN